MGQVQSEPAAPCCAQAPDRLNATPAAGWGSLADGVYQQMQVRPQALALASGGQPWTYQALGAQAAGLAAHWLAGPGWQGVGEQPPRVGILASRSPEACIAALGAAWAGATYVPIGLKLPEERILRILAQARLSALVADAQGARLLTPAVLQAAPEQLALLGPQPAGLGPRVQWLPPQALALKAPTPPRPLAPGQAAYILFTSGTTGEPKGVVVPWRAAGHYVRAMARHQKLTPADRVLDLFELGFDVSVHNLFCTWQAGACLHQLPASQVMNAVRWVREQSLTVWNSVPSLVGLLAQVKALGPGAMPSLRLSQFGGEQLTQGVVEAWRRSAPASEIHNLYGPTEATVTCLAQRVEEPLPLAAGSDVLAIGRPLAGCEAAIWDAQGEPLGDGHVGELVVAGVQLASGYLDDPQRTAERFVWRGGQRWYRTGDLALCDAAGRYHCLGRMDHQVKVLGHRVELEDVDAHLRQVLGVPWVASVAWPRAGARAQGLVAFACGARLGEQEAMQALRARLPAYMVPARVVSLSQLPTNANGKVDRQALLQLLDAGLAG